MVPVRTGGGAGHTSKRGVHPDGYAAMRGGEDLGIAAKEVSPWPCIRIPAVYYGRFLHPPMSTASTPPEHDSRAAGREDTVTVAPAPTPASPQVGLDKPIYTISVAAEILETHPRTLMMYEHLGLVVPHRTATNRRRYSQRDILTLQAIQRLTRHHGLNLNGARYVIQLLQLMDANRITRPEHLADVDVTHVKL